MAGFPAMTQPPEGTKIEEAELQYYDGSSRRVFYTDVEFKLPEDMIIVSRTDVRGIITHVNYAFIEASAYPKDELINSPHCVLRHPHMPKSIFTDLWQTMKKHDEWSGPIKNLRKDGGYYWVHAVIQQNRNANGDVVSYQSVRTHLPQDQVDKYEKLYAEMLAEEKHGRG